MASQFRRRRQWSEYELCSTDIIMHFRDILTNLYLKCSIRHSKGTLLTVYRTVLILVLLIKPLTAQRPGCHLVGNTRTVRIPNCSEFEVTTNGCKGYCESYAIPSPSNILSVNIRHQITSRAECCSIDETEDNTLWVSCIDGPRRMVFKSAISCQCSVCRS